MRILDWLRNSVIGGVEDSTTEPIERHYPDAEYRCHDCGAEYLPDDSEDSASAYFKGTCDICGTVTAVTHIRNYNYLRIKRHK